MSNEDPSPWPVGTPMCSVCSARPAVVTWPEGGPSPMCSSDYAAYIRAQPVD